MSTEWFKKPVKDLISAVFALDMLIIFCMKEDYHARFVGSNKQESNFALTSQPRITFDSDRQHYAFSSSKETKLSGCRGSSEDAGQPKRCRARRSTSMMRLCDKDRGLTLIRSLKLSLVLFLVALVLSLHFFSLVYFLLLKETTHSEQTQKLQQTAFEAR